MTDVVMKNSEFKWIEEIPIKWSVEKIKYFYSIIGGNGFPEILQGYDSGEIPFCKVSDINGDEIFVNQAQNYVTYEVQKQYKFNLIPINSILFAKIGEALKKNHRKLNSVVCCIDNNTQALSIKNKNIVDYKFSYYLFKIIDMKEFNNEGAIPSINNTKLKNYFIPIPPFNEQLLISSFLDVKCSNIDSIINDLERQIEILEKYKKSVITEAVTKGLNPDVELKESGVEWIGKIPVNWKVRKLKYVLSSPLQYGANETGIDFSDELPRYIRISDISLDNKLKEEGKLSLDFNVAKQYILKHNDILFARSGATVGKTFLYLESYGLCCFAGYLIRANINNKIVFPKYVYYTTLGNGYENWKDKVFSQATIQNIGADKYNLYKLPVPTLEEQVDIVNHIDSKCFEIDSIIEDKKTQVETIKKYKNSLIYEYVTGKKRVSQGDVNE